MRKIISNASLIFTLIKSGGGTGPMKPGNLSQEYNTVPVVIRCQFPRDEIQPKNPVLGEACHADAVHAKPRFFLCMPPCANMISEGTFRSPTIRLKC